MIVNTTRIVVRAENRKELLQTITSLVDPIRNEKGCLTHRFYQEASNQNAFLLLGEWETQDDWDNHVKSDNFAVLLGSIMVLSSRPDIDLKLLSHVSALESETKARICFENQFD